MAEEPQSPNFDGVYDPQGPRAFLVKNADSFMNQEISEIQNSNIGKVISSIPKEGMEYLDKRMRFPRKLKGGVKMTQARNLLYQFVQDRKFLHTNDPKKLMAMIKDFLESHPTEREIDPQTSVPNWAKAYNPNKDFDRGK